jgi:hypothetical protein
MPIILLSKDYTDLFGTSRTFYKANAGDRQHVRFIVRESIAVTTSPTISLALDIPNYEITWLGGDFEDEGFRTGDLIQTDVWNSAGVNINSYTSNVVYVSGNVMGVSSLLGWYDQTQGEKLRIAVINRGREGAKVSINHVKNGLVGTALSLIDGEPTQATFDLTGSTPYSPTFVAKQSGQFWWNVGMSLSGATSIYRDWQLDIDFIQSGIYDQSWFTSANCLKLFVKISWQSLIGEPYANEETIISEDADTGWFDEPHNIGAVDATLVQGISNIAFDQPTTAQIVVDCASTAYGFGFSYVPQDVSYYKNVFPNQSTLSGMMSTAIPMGIMTGFALPNGGIMSFQVLSATQVGTIWTFDVKFTPDTAFTNFMLNKTETDRLFYVWCKIGNLNLLVYNDQLKEQPVVGGIIPMLVEDFHDHSENITTGTGVETTYEANVEDDLAFYGAFRIADNEIINSFTAKLRAHNPMSGEYFDLQTAQFPFAAIPQVGGVYVLNQTAVLWSQFDTNSVKRNAKLKLNPTYNGMGEYGVDIYFPFLYRWEYWLQQLNADSDFYPNQQTMDYVPYGNNMMGWILEVRLELVRNGVLWFHDYPVTIKDYDSDPTIDQTMQLYVQSTNQPVNVIVEGEMMRVECLHTLNDGKFWTTNLWGMITVESTETSPRWWSSTAVPFDGNALNPLTPITGSLCEISYPNFNQVKLSCLFNPSKINLQNGVKFTSKIKGCSTSIRPKFKQTTSGGIKMTTTGGYKEMN